MTYSCNKNATKTYKCVVIITLMPGSAVHSVFKHPHQ